MARQNDERGEDISAKGASEKAGGNGEKRRTDAIEMLKADHRRVEELFDKYEGARRRAEKSRLAQQICLELTIHAQLEEEIFYPACREHVDDPMLDEAQVEHDTAKILMTEIAMGTPAADPFFDAKVKVLSEYMRHHIQEEEKDADSIFAEAMRGGVDTAALGRRMSARREELMAQFDEELLLPQPRTLHVTLAQDEEVWSEPVERGQTRGRKTQGRGREDVWGGREEGRWEERGEDERRSARGGREEQRESGARRESDEAESPRRGAQAREGRETSAARGREEERGGREHKGWIGDPGRHAEAARRGWEHRR